jgi:hypothetical protein
MVLIVITIRDVGGLNVRSELEWRHSYLLREHLSPKISQRKLEATVAVVEEHFDSNEVIWAWM